MGIIVFTVYIYCILGDRCLSSYKMAQDTSGGKILVLSMDTIAGHETTSYFCGTGFWGRGRNWCFR